MSEKPDLSQINLRPMRLADLNQVEAIDAASFPTPWPRDAFLYELKRLRGSLAWVAEWTDSDGNGEVVASIVIWLVLDEAHIATLAVKPGYRQRGIAKKLLAESLIECAKRGAKEATLEVRISNLAAQNLYQKFGFEVVGRRKNYYKDTHEDALLMTLSPVNEEKLAVLVGKG